MTSSVVKRGMGRDIKCFGFSFSFARCNVILRPNRQGVDEKEKEEFRRGMEVSYCNSSGLLAAARRRKKKTKKNSRKESSGFRKRERVSWASRAWTARGGKGDLLANKYGGTREDEDWATPLEEGRSTDGEGKDRKKRKGVGVASSAHYKKQRG